jgi:hypothetical protein
VELGFRFERGWGVWFSGVPLVAERAGEAPPDAIMGICSCSKVCWLFWGLNLVLGRADEDMRRGMKVGRFGNSREVLARLKL